MAKPDPVPSFAQAVYDQLQPLQYAEERLDWPLLVYCIAIGQMFQQFDFFAHADGDLEPWAKFLDINSIPCEGVPWFGQLVGVIVDRSLSCDDQRQQIRDLEGWDRGTVAYMRKMIQRSGGLIGNMSVIIRERFTDAYNFRVYTYPNETLQYTTTPFYSTIYDGYPNYAMVFSVPSYADLYYSKGEGLVWDAILASKPAGLVATYEVTYPQDYWGLWVDYATYQAIYDGFATYAAVYNYSSTTGSPGFVDPLYDQTIYPSYYRIFTKYGSYQNVYDTYLTYQSMYMDSLPPNFDTDPPVYVPMWNAINTYADIWERYQLYQDLYEQHTTY